MIENTGHPDGCLVCGFKNKLNFYDANVKVSAAEVDVPPFVAFTIVTVYVPV